jgi:hypothetical protein
MGKLTINDDGNDDGEINLSDYYEGPISFNDNNGTWYRMEDASWFPLNNANIGRMSHFYEEEVVINNGMFLLFAVGSNTPPLGAVRISKYSRKMVVDPTVK